MTFFPETRILAADTPSIDAFGRWRTSTTTIIADSRTTHGKDTLRWDEALTGGATSVSLPNEAAIALTVPATTVSSVVRQTKRAYSYQLAKSQAGYFSGVFGSPEAGITRRVGLLNANNGLFLQSGPTDISFGIRSFVTGAPVDTLFPQSAWNKDKLDGTGPSGITLDLGTSHIFFVDYQWFGVGRVRYGFILNGLYVIAHEFVQANVGAGVYMTTPNLNLRYEIENDGTGAEATMRQICSAVSTEGTRDSRGISRTFDTGVTSPNYSGGTTYSKLAIRLKVGFEDSQIFLTNFNLQSAAGNDVYLWQVVVNPTVAGTLTFNPVDAESFTEGAAGALANTVSDPGTVLFSGYATGDVNISAAFRTPSVIGTALDGTRDELHIIFTPINAQELLAALNWTEPF